MKSAFDHHSENLVRSANRLLKEMEEFKDLKKSLFGEDADLPQRADEAPGGKPERQETIQHDDGRVELSVSEDGMKAVANIYPARGGGLMPSMDLMKKRLREEGIVFGVDWELAEEAVLQCVTGKKHVADVPLAQGKEPKCEIPAHMELLQKFAAGIKLPEEQNKQIDYKEQTPFAVVTKGELIAKERPLEPGEEGSTVYGKPLPFETKRLPELTPGANTERIGDEIRSAKDGRLVVQGDDFFIQEVLEIKGDVDYSTGNIRFGGDVVVGGTVQEGFIIEIGGSLYCKSSLDATQVLCGKDLTVSGGIIGKKKGQIKTGGTVKCRFIEHCLLEAKGRIFAEKAILHSLVRTAASIDLGSKGTIIGGKVYAKDGINTVQLGSDIGTRTEIRLGVEPEKERRILWLRKKLEEIQQKLKEISGVLLQKPDDEKLLAIQEKLKAQAASAEKTSADLTASLEKNPAAAAAVTGFVFPGVIVEILDARFVVTKVLKAVRFTYDEGGRRITVTQL